MSETVLHADLLYTIVWFIVYNMEQVFNVSVPSAVAVPEAALYSVPHCEGEGSCSCGKGSEKAVEARAAAAKDSLFSCISH